MQYFYFLFQFKFSFILAFLLNVSWLHFKPINKHTSFFFVKHFQDRNFYTCLNMPLKEDFPIKITQIIAFFACKRTSFQKNRYEALSRKP